MVQGKDKAACRKLWAALLPSIVLMKNSVQVACAVQYANYLYAFRHGAVKDDVPAYRKASQSFRQFFAGAAYL